MWRFGSNERHANKSSTGSAESPVALGMICDSVGASFLKCRMRVIKSASLPLLRVTPELREAIKPVLIARDVLAVGQRRQEDFC